LTSFISVGQLLPWLGLLSVITFLGSLLVVPWLVLMMSPDYFIRHRLEVIERHRRHPVLTILLFCLRNIVGFGLLAAGVAMLVLPGQGILTMLIGFSLMDFPGKHRLLEKVVQNGRVQQSLNWIRRKGGKEDLVFTTEPVKG
jgi:hypothetical protein